MSPIKSFPIRSGSFFDAFYVTNITFGVKYGIIYNFER